MKILMLLEAEFPPDTRVENEIEALTTAGYEVHVACFTRKNKPAFDKHNGAFIHRKPISNFIYKSSIGSLKFNFYFNFWREFVTDIFRNEKFDAIHIHDLPLSIIGTEIKEKYNIPLIIDLHENWPGLLNVSLHTKTLAGRFLCNISEWEEYEKKYLPKADRIIVVVNEAADRVRKLIEKEKEIVIVSNTINLAGISKMTRKAKSPSQKKILIYEGGITYHRGLQYVLKALAGIKDKADKLEFQIIGKGNYLETLKKMAVELKIENMVNFVGWQSQEKVFEMLESADIALIPHIKSSHTDTTIPHKIFHYMNAGIPVLASNCSPLERIVNETSSGYVYEYNNTDDLASKIELLLSATRDFDKTSMRDWVEKKYNWSVDGSRLVSAYKELLR